MKALNLVFNKITSIYKSDLNFFILLFVLFSITDVYYNIINNQYAKCLYILINAYVFSGFTCLALAYINKYKYIRKTCNVIIILFTLVYTIINIYSIFLTLKPFNHGIIELFISTNYNEMIEFIESYFSIFHFILIIIVFALFIVFSLREYLLNINFIVKALSFLFILNTFLVIINRYSIFDTPIGRLYIVYRDRSRIEITPDLSLYRNNPEFTATNDSHPANIVVVIGESFAKTHSSLYGYHKNTNPLLEIHKKDSNLYVFDNIVAPASHTMEAFKAIMSTFSYHRDDSVWYKHTTIPECFNKLGYKTIWISNQHQYGAFDNIPTRFSQLCDTSIFTKKNITDNFKDGQILKYLNEKSLGKEFIVVHLMGQHFKCSERYPDEFNLFAEKDYLNLQEHQRKNVAEYDNATLYNDFVVDSIIKSFKNKESILFYFSDHGQDIYFSDDNYYGHGITANEKSDSIGRDIPFMIYTSPLFEENYPDLIKKIQNSTNRTYNTENLLFTLLDIAGYKFKENNDVEKYSLLSIE